MNVLISFFIFYTRVLAQEPISPDTVLAGDATPHETQDPIQQCLDLKRKEKLTRETTPTGAPLSYYFKKVNPSKLPNSCVSGDLKTLQTALSLQIKGCKKTPPAKQVPKTFGCRTLSFEEWCTKANEKMLEISQSVKSVEEFHSQVKEQMDWYQSSGSVKGGKRIKPGEFQVTSYDTPTHDVSQKKQGRYIYPIYKKPKNFISFTKEDLAKYTPPQSPCGRQPITNEPRRFCLKNKDGSFSPIPDVKDIQQTSEVLAYVDDPLKAYDIMMQGSGYLRLVDKGNKLVRANYDGQNGAIHFMLSQVINCSTKVDGQEIPTASLTPTAIHDYFLTIPESKRLELLNYTRAVVFLQEKPLSEGSFGAANVKLTPKVSVAVDPSVIPLGVPMLLTRGPRDEKSCGFDKRDTRFVIAQDTGGAIKGADIDDLASEEKGDDAGQVNFPGSVFVALPKNTGEQRENCRE